MINFFRRIRKQLATENNAKKYLRYAIGEILLVVIGILVALQINNWNEQRKERQKEQSFLKQLLEDFSESEKRMNTTQMFFLEIAISSSFVVKAFWEPEKYSHQEIASQMGNPLRSDRKRPILATIEALVSTGDLNLILSDSIRSHLLSYLEQSKAHIENIQRLDETYYRPATNVITKHIDIQAVYKNEKDNIKRPSRAYLYAGYPQGNIEPPFPVNIQKVLQNKAVYDAYQNILVAHRNQGWQYVRLMYKTRVLRGEIYKELYGRTEAGNCNLLINNGFFSGNIGEIIPGNGNASLILETCDSVFSGNWQQEKNSIRYWRGSMQIDGYKDEHIEIETDFSGQGVIRTQFGWFPVEGLLRYSSGLSFRINYLEEISPNKLDAEIIKRTKELLNSDEVWDKNDDRKCQNKETKLSLYCAIKQACIELTGGFHHRRPALQLVRKLLNENIKDRGYKHRFRDYNNDASTTLVDIHNLLDEALQAVNLKQD
ncbi:MAG: hypothetical protein DRJ07_10015 [Bacteroidetes bacterium]|nr:MAG: hypothetical protein DRJ07_10015 [Bacteroidota bacterium]